jgi:RNA polymerase sigma-70 factor (ECF subfamily)
VQRQPQATGTIPDDIVSLFDRALPEVYHYLLHRCRQRSIAEDLTSEAFLAAVDAIRRGAVAAPTVGWLIGIARHKMLDHWRRVERESRHLELLASDESVELVEPIEPGRALDVLTQLNPSQRAALTLRHVDGLSVPDVASLLGRSVHATETLLVRARAAFRARYSTNEDLDV